MHHHGAIKLTRDIGLIGSSKISAPFKLRLNQTFLVSLMQHPDCVVVVNPWERRHNSFEFSRVALEQFQLFTSILQNSRGNVGQHSFGQCEHIFKASKSHFRLDHPELCQVSPGFGFLCSKRRTKTVNLAKGSGSRFVVKLARLRQVRLLAFEIVDFEKSSRSFTRSWCEYGRIAECESIVVEKISNGLHHRVPHLQYRVLPSRAEPQVPM